MTCLHHLGVRGYLLSLDQDRGGHRYSFTGSVFVTAPTSCDRGFQKKIIASPNSTPPIALWSRDFRGTGDQVREVRHWLADLLPECRPRADVLLLASELCANAVVHSRSGEAGGRFGVDVEWTPTLARVVIVDQGSAKALAMDARTGDATRSSESGRGLLLVNELADDWGTAGRPNRRWVWADVCWHARGGLPLAAPGGVDAVIADMTMIRKAFPGTSVWWGHQSACWWAAVSGATDANGLIRSPTRDGLIQALADAYPLLLRHPGGGV